MVAVLDANVLISAILFGGKPRRVVRLALAGRYEAVVSPPMLAEVGAVLNSAKFAFSPEQAEAVVAEISSSMQVVEPALRVRAVRADPDDDRVLECAVASRADFIVTGDRHLLQLGGFRGVGIVSPDAFLKRLAAGS